MNEDVMLFGITIILCAAAVLYLIWTRQHEREQSQHKNDHQDLLLEIQRELARQHTDILRRCAELQRNLDDHRRILRYLRHRLS